MVVDIAELVTYMYGTGTESGGSAAELIGLREDIAESLSKGAQRL